MYINVLIIASETHTYIIIMCLYGTKILVHPVVRGGGVGKGINGPPKHLCASLKTTITRIYHAHKITGGVDVMWVVNVVYFVSLYEQMSRRPWCTRSGRVSYNS